MGQLIGSHKPDGYNTQRAAFTEEGTCPHCGYYKDKNCTNDEYCAVKEENPMLFSQKMKWEADHYSETLEEVCQQMEDKAKAKMLINMHLGIKDTFQPTSSGLKYYSSLQFLDGVRYTGHFDMVESKKIAWAYPGYEIAALFNNGDLVIFSTEGRELHVMRIAGREERAQILQDIEDAKGNMETHWDNMNNIHIPNTKRIWGAPL